MNTRTHSKHAPAVTTAMAAVAFIIHVILSVIDFNFTALINEMPIKQSGLNTLIFSIIQPLALAAFIAPVLLIIRHSNFITEFKNILFIAVGLFIIYTLADMAGITR
ncbi:MAG: hypothetical protein ACI8SR_000908 [Oceanicoccus sp.]|jgi:hypothetical protein